jgi:hypothetical protein
MTAKKTVKIQKLPWWAFKARRWKTETIKQNIYQNEIIVRMQLDGYDILTGQGGDALYFVPRPSLVKQDKYARTIMWKHPRHKSGNISRWRDSNLGVQSQWWRPGADLVDINELQVRSKCIKVFEILRYYRAQLKWLTRYSGWLPTVIQNLCGEANQ